MVVITGAGSGIGRALSVAFAGQGAPLALNDHKEETLRETLDLLGLPADRVFSRTFSVADKAAMFDFAEATAAHFGRVDVMINNAGVGLGDYAFDELDLSLLEWVMSVNYFGVVYGSRAFIPYLLKQPEAALVNVSSVYGLAGISGGHSYCSSKFAVNGLNQSLIQEYRNSTLRVHSVHPGGIKTNITRNAVDYQKKFEVFDKNHFRHTPEYAASVIINGIRKKKSRILIGSEAYQLDWIVRLMPIWGATIVNKILDKTRAEVARFVE